MPDEIDANPLGDDFVPRDAGVPGRTAVMPVESEEDEKPEKPEELPTSKLAETLDALNARISSSSENARLLADPDVRALLQLKQNGKTFKIVEAGVEPTTQREEAPPDLESMTNAQLVQYQTAQTVKALDAIVEKRVSARIAELEAKVSPALETALSHAQNEQSRRINNDIEACRAKHKDFDQMRPKMAELNKTIQGLSVEELYFTAKVRSGLPIVSQKEIETERPSSSAGQRRTFKSPPDTRGRKGFASLLDAALEDVGSDKE